MVKFIQFIEKNMLQIIYCAMLFIAFVPLPNGILHNTYIIYKLAPSYILGILCVILFYSKIGKQNTSNKLNIILPVAINIIGILGIVYFLNQDKIIIHYTYIESILAACAACIAGQITALLIFNKKNG